MSQGFHLVETIMHTLRSFHQEDIITLTKPTLKPWLFSVAIHAPAVLGRPTTSNRCLSTPVASTRTGADAGQLGRSSAKEGCLRVPGRTLGVVPLGLGSPGLLFKRPSLEM